MILVDTSVWVDHIRATDDFLAHLLEIAQVLMHPFVFGEVALGNLRERDLFLEQLENLPQAIVATHYEVLHLINQQSLFGQGIGYVDAHLLAAVRLTEGAALLTHDKRLHAAAVRLGLQPKLSS